MPEVSRKVLRSMEQDKLCCAPGMRHKANMTVACMFCITPGLPDLHVPGYREEFAGPGVERLRHAISGSCAEGFEERKDLLAKLVPPPEKIESLTDWNQCLWRGAGSWRIGCRSCCSAGRGRCRCGCGHFLLCLHLRRVLSSTALWSLNRHVEIWICLHGGH